MEQGVDAIHLCAHFDDHYDSVGDRGLIVDFYCADSKTFG
jgi:hypothetical protein